MLNINLKEPGPAVHICTEMVKNLQLSKLITAYHVAKDKNIPHENVGLVILQSGGIPIHVEEMGATYLQKKINK